MPSIDGSSRRPDTGPPSLSATRPRLDAYPVSGSAGLMPTTSVPTMACRCPPNGSSSRAARGSRGEPYPWGDAPPDKTRVSRGSEACCHGDDSDGFPMTAPVGSFPKGASPDGILDLIGNVWEWTAIVRTLSRRTRSGDRSPISRASRRRMEQRYSPPQRQLPAGLRSRFFALRPMVDFDAFAPPSDAAGVAATWVGVTVALADPTSDRGYAIETVHKNGAILPDWPKTARRFWSPISRMVDSTAWTRRAASRHSAAASPWHRRHRRSDGALPHCAFRQALSRLARLDAGRRQGGAVRPRAARDRETSVRRIVHRDSGIPSASSSRRRVHRRRRRPKHRRTRDAGRRQTTLFEFPRLNGTKKRSEPVADRVSGKKPYEVDAVPTGLAEREDRLYVSLSAGFPTSKAARRRLAGQAGRNTEARLEMTVRHAGRHRLRWSGRLLILEHGRFDQATGFVPGSGR